MEQHKDTRNDTDPEREGERERVCVCVRVYKDRKVSSIVYITQGGWKKSKNNEEPLCREWRH